MQKVTVSLDTYLKMLEGLVKSGAAYEAHEDKSGDIVIKFTGGI